MESLKVNRAFVLMMIIIFSSTIIGCYDMKELDNRAFVLVLGVEKSKISNIKLTVMLASPKNLVGGGPGGGGGGDIEKGLVITSIDAPTVPLAINLINTYVGRTLYFGHASYTFLSEEFVKNGYETSLISPEKNREIRRDGKFFIVRGDVAEFINKIKPLIAANPTKYLRQIVDSQNTSGLIPSSDTYKFYQDVEGFKEDALLPLCSINKGNEIKKQSKYNWDINFKAGELDREGGLPIEFLGSAVFKGNKMVDTLDGMETRMINLIRGKFQSAIFAFPDIYNPKFLETVIIKRGKTPKVKVDLSGKQPKISVLVSLDGDLHTVQGYTDYSKDPNISKLEEKIENLLSMESNNLIKKMQKRNTDIFGFGYYIAKEFLTWDEFKDYKWLKEKFKIAKIDVKYSYHIRRIGYQGGPTKPGD